MVEKCLHTFNPSFNVTITDKCVTIIILRRWKLGSEKSKRTDRGKSREEKTRRKTNTKNCELWIVCVLAAVATIQHKNHFEIGWKRNIFWINLKHAFGDPFKWFSCFWPTNMNCDSFRALPKKWNYFMSDGTTFSDLIAKIWKYAQKESNWNCNCFVERFFFLSPRSNTWVLLLRLIVELCQLWKCNVIKSVKRFTFKSFELIFSENFFSPDFNQTESSIVQQKLHHREK